MFRGITLDLHGDLVVEQSACMRVVKSEVQHRNVIVKGQTNSYSQPPSAYMGDYHYSEFVGYRRQTRKKGTFESFR